MPIGSTVDMNKRMLRSEVRALRAQQAHADVMRKSLAIEKTVTESARYKEAVTVLLYASSRNEVHTLCLIETALADGKSVALPHMAPDETLVPLLVTDTSELKRNHYGVLEPTMRASKAPPESIDLAIIPGVAFDTKCRRLGMGKGCYDKLLPSLDEATVIGLAFELQIVEEVPIDKHDLPVDAVVTEKRVVRCP